MVGRSVDNANEVRLDIMTRALLSRRSTDIYADICTVYGSYLLSFFSQFADGLGNSVQAQGLL